MILTMYHKTGTWWTEIPIGGVMASNNGTETIQVQVVRSNILILDSTDLNSGNLVGDGGVKEDYSSYKVNT